MVGKNNISVKLIMSDVYNCEECKCSNCKLKAISEKDRDNCLYCLRLCSGTVCLCDDKLLMGVEIHE